MRSLWIDVGHSETSILHSPATKTSCSVSKMDAKKLRQWEKNVMCGATHEHALFLRSTWILNRYKIMQCQIRKRLPECVNVLLQAATSWTEKWSHHKNAKSCSSSNSNLRLAPVGNQSPLGPIWKCLTSQQKKNMFTAWYRKLPAYQTNDGQMNNHCNFRNKFYRSKMFTLKSYGNIRGTPLVKYQRICQENTVPTGDDIECWLGISLISTKYYKLKQFIILPEKRSNLYLVTL